MLFIEDQPVGYFADNYVKELPTSLKGPSNSLVLLGLIIGLMYRVNPA